ncbi:hypothetical protein DUI87_23108 [Hirundo rustica rustica]|uniref:Uncharacterized protein n=1 Tax=Hirundo rustica rustica TaxID=333673 RepID=A0A3M0K036_HIRRU|nr:hypothetical protein DUI87_23108 [Hirundo rustica rustica]
MELSGFWCEDRLRAWVGMKDGDGQEIEFPNPTNCNEKMNGRPGLFPGYSRAVLLSAEARVQLPLKYVDDNQKSCFRFCQNSASCLFGHV